LYIILPLAATLRLSSRIERKSPFLLATFLSSQQTFPVMPMGLLYIVMPRLFCDHLIPIRTAFRHYHSFTPPIIPPTYIQVHVTNARFSTGHTLTKKHGRYK
jgi:hypothetical protein